MRVIIAGCRDYENMEGLKSAIRLAGFQISEVVSGKCPMGVDRLGERWANANKLPVSKFPADWQKYGRSAGPRRNQQMARYGEALIAVWDGKSAGTGDMIRKAEVAGIDIYIHYI